MSKSLQPTGTSRNFSGYHVVAVLHLYVCGTRHTGVEAADGTEDVDAFEFFVGVAGVNIF